MAINNPEIFPKTTRSIETDADQITDSAFFYGTQYWSISNGKCSEERD
jgi:hypothetical protein